MITLRGHADGVRRRSATLVVAAGALLGLAVLTGCADGAEEEEADEPYDIESIDEDGTRIRLEHEAVEQLGISTTVLALPVGGLGVLPYAALLYGPDGATYVYTSAEDDTYDRYSVTVHHVEGDEVYLSEGPAQGTSVVTQGGAELTGMEFGLEDE